MLWTLVACVEKEPVQTTTPTVPEPEPSCTPKLVWQDADGDGYGAGEPLERCEPEPGEVLAEGDCDDTDSARHPGATELCGGIDEDCDGLSDERALLGGRSFGSVAEAVQAAVAGDEVLVCDGQHVEQGIGITVPLTVASVSGDREAATLAGDGSGPIFVVNGGELTLRALTVRGGRSQMGGAVNALLGEGGPVTVESCRFEGNRAEKGGALAVSSLVATDTDFVGNRAQSQDPYLALGGAIYVAEGGSASLTSSLLEGNTAHLGGAIHSWGSLSLETTTLRANEAAFGGAVFISGDYDASASLTLVGATFEANRADYGGAVYVSDVSTEADADTLFVENEAYIGGALHLIVYSSQSWSGGTFLRNTTWPEGGSGAIHALAQAALELSLLHVEDNESGYGGGLGLYSGSSPLTLLDSTILGNTASQFGGGLWVQGRVRLEGVSLVQNEAPEGGALCGDIGEVNLVDGIVEENVATTRGGGIRLEQELALQVESTDFGTDLTDNSPDDVSTFGGDLSNYGADATFSCDDEGCL